MKEKTKREAELVWAIEVQTECLQDLKNLLVERDNQIQTLHTLIEYQQTKIKKLMKGIHSRDMELNWQWN